MPIHHLANTPLEDIVDCLSKAFADYFVPMPSELAFWQNRFAGARVDFNLSFGMFEANQLVGFIINGIDYKNGEKHAFNTGTGVLPSHRGKRIVDQLYDYAKPHFKAGGVSQLSLEVIEQNDRAIRVYERIGFDKTKKLLCFKGDLQHFEERVKIQQTAIKELVNFPNPNQHYYSWDNTNIAILKSNGIYQLYQIRNKNDEPIGFFVINPSNNYVAQIELLTDHNESNWNQLFAGIQQLTKSFRINNVDDRRVHFVQQLLRAGLHNSINQYEMERSMD